MVSILQAIILGIIQGITEWLPISSSGHLVIAQHLFDISQPVIFDIILHLGSLAALLIVFWKDIVRLVKGIFLRDKYYVKYFFWLVIATIPIGLVGIFFNDYIKTIFDNPKTVGISLLITAIILFISKYPLKKKKKLTWKNTFVIGLFQALAILPGISRSGMTISSGMFQGVERKEVARFSFLLFIPAILGATVFEIGNVSSIGNMFPLIIGTIATFITGYVTLKWLLKIIENGKFSYFAWYCFVVGLLVLFIL